MKKEKVVRFTAEQFWELLPRAIELLNHEWRRLHTFGLVMIPHPEPVSGRRRPAPGEPIRWFIQSITDTHRFSPLTAVLWLVTGRDDIHVGDRRAGSIIGLPPAFQDRLYDATFQLPGYSLAVRTKLHKACRISDTYLRPTTA